jgi:hypothetical protein
MYRITTEPNVLPFQQVAMDLITGLPKHNGKDATSSDLPPLQYDNNRTRDSPIISEPHIQVVWAPQEGHQQSRPLLHVALRKKLNQMTRSPTEPILSLL